MLALPLSRFSCGRKCQTHSRPERYQEEPRPVAVPLGTHLVQQTACSFTWAPFLWKWGQKRWRCWGTLWRYILSHCIYESTAPLWWWNREEQPSFFEVTAAPWYMRFQFSSVQCNPKHYYGQRKFLRELIPGRLDRSDQISTCYKRSVNSLNSSITDTEPGLSL